ncbi:9522_t:CDS:2 [Entrophospora sp. SA101]|nr:12201_t:CDS:2 [Entrophospora sp. SA101]CAJ0769549.1 9522_t:CDS:2 [Entrophospora sp. SA101]CAJ0835497.1 11032_t:CDS:2 [Entrophospora sp. SA101]CAJ0884326.1 16989_t:CDS:2 [Entrophospora sp. SA101]
MGVKSSKTSASTRAAPIVNSNKADNNKLKKYINIRNSVLFSFDGNNYYNNVSANIQETWRFTGGGKRIHNIKNLKILPNQQQHYQNLYQEQLHQRKLIREEIERLQRQNNLYKRIWQNAFSSPVEELLKSDEGIRVLEVGLMVTAFTATEWEEKVIPELVRVTRQGGYIELMESDIQYSNEGPIAQRLTDALLPFMKSKGVIAPINTYVLQSLLSNTQLAKDIKTEEKSCFLGKWAGELGWNAVKLPMSTLMRIKSHDYDDIVNNFGKEVEQYKTYFKTWRFSIQKVSAARSSSITTPSPWQN